MSRALFDAGAGRIGNYSSCSFRSPGTGTFFGGDGSQPTVGQSGRLEKADEIRLETVVPIGEVDAVIRALRASHPYEEPAFDLNVLAATVGDKGQGRIGSIPPTARGELFDRIKRELGIGHLLIAGPMDGTITRAAVCAGSCGDMLDDAIKAKAGIVFDRRDAASRCLQGRGGGIDGRLHAAFQQRTAGVEAIGQAAWGNAGNAGDYGQFGG